MEYGLERLGPGSRKRVRRGDVFMLQPIGGPKMYGIVYSTKARWWESSQSCKLIGVHRCVGEIDDPLSLVFDRDGLVTASMLVVVGWTTGEFLTIGNRPLMEEETRAPSSLVERTRKVELKPVDPVTSELRDDEPLIATTLFFNGGVAQEVLRCLTGSEPWGGGRLFSAVTGHPGWYADRAGPGYVTAKLRPKPAGPPPPWPR